MVVFEGEQRTLTAVELLRESCLLLKFGDKVLRYPATVIVLSIYSLCHLGRNKTLGKVAYVVGVVLECCLRIL